MTRVPLSRAARLSLALIGASSLAGCATGATAGANRIGADQAAIGLTAAEALATAYAGRPACGPGAGPICSDAATVGRIKAADKTAYGAVKAAEAAPSNASVGVADMALVGLVAAIPASAKGGK